jgi:hypothetical protein
MISIKKKMFVFLALKDVLFFTLITSLSSSLKVWPKINGLLGLYTKN